METPKRLNEKKKRALVCGEVLRPSQPNGVMSSAVSLPNHTFTGQTKSSKQFTSIVHILSPETDNCPSWISGRERMTVENISWSIFTKECCRPRRGLNPQPPGLQSDGASNWATEAGKWALVPYANIKGQGRCAQFEQGVLCQYILQYPIWFLSWEWRPWSDYGVMQADLGSCCLYMTYHYENMPIQIYWKFHHQKLEVFW